MTRLEEVAGNASDLRNSISILQVLLQKVGSELEFVQEHFPGPVVGDLSVELAQFQVERCLALAEDVFGDLDRLTDI